MQYIIQKRVDMWTWEDVMVFGPWGEDGVWDSVRESWNALTSTKFHRIALRYGDGTQQTVRGGVVQ